MQQPREVLRAVVHPWHCDSFGHMNVRWYGYFFDDASYHVWPAYWGSHQRMQDEFGVHTVTGRATTEFRKELVAGDLIIAESVVSRVGTKSATFLIAMKHVDTGVVHATYEVSEVFFDPATRASAPIPAPVREALESVLI